MTLHSFYQRSRIYPKNNGLLSSMYGYTLKKVAINNIKLLIVAVFGLMTFATSTSMAHHHNEPTSPEVQTQNSTEENVSTANIENEVSDTTDNNTDVPRHEGYELVWSDEFNIDGRPNPENWTYENGFVRNNEAQWYQPENAEVKDGHLVITGKREIRLNPNYEAGSDSWRRNREFIEYTSACIKSPGLRSFQFGRFEVRAKIVAEEGLWPAIWFLGNEGRWPACGEVDLMEYYGGDILANAAWLNPVDRDDNNDFANRGYVAWDSSHTPVAELGGKDWDETFHIWRMDWDEKEIKLYVDDRLLNTIDLTKTINREGRRRGRAPENPFHQPHYILLNLAIGGTQGGNPINTDFPSEYLIDYVRVYQKTDEQDSYEYLGEKSEEE